MNISDRLVFKKQDMNFADGNGNLGILIYIIAAVVGLAVNAYRNYSKRKQSAGTQKPVASEPDFPEVLFEPVFTEQEVPSEEEEVIFEEDQYSEPDNPVIIDEKTEEVFQTYQPSDTPVLIEEKELEGVAAFSSTAEQLLSDDINESLIEIEGDLGESIMDTEVSKTEIRTGEEVTDEEVFNLREAVIYSEILNAKYINNNY